MFACQEKGEGGSLQTSSYVRNLTELHSYSKTLDLQGCMALANTYTSDAKIKIQCFFLSFNCSCLFFLSHP